MSTLRLKQRWDDAHRINGMEPNPFQHRCKEQLTSTGGPNDCRCDCDIRNFFWDRACPLAELCLAYGRQHGNGISCLQCDYTSQFCEFHRSALPELRRCCGCLLDMRTEVIITVRPDPAEGKCLGEYMLKAAYALGGTIITMQTWRVLPNAFGTLGCQLWLWMKLLHARVLCDEHGPPRIHSNGHMVSFEMLRAGVQVEDDSGEATHQWLVAGLRTFQISILLERGLSDESALFRQHELSPAAHELASFLHANTASSP